MLICDMTVVMVTGTLVPVDAKASYLDGWWFILVSVLNQFSFFSTSVRN